MDTGETCLQRQQRPRVRGFVRDVRAYAFTQGKQRDNAWMADFASTCLHGAAVRWFMELEPDVQEDWILLGKALLQKYPCDNELQSTSVSPAATTPPGFSISPTPAAAPHRAFIGAPNFIDQNLRKLGNSTSSSRRPSLVPPNPFRDVSVSDEPNTMPSERYVVPFTRSDLDALKLVRSASLASHNRLETPVCAPRVGRIMVILAQQGSTPVVKYVRRTMNWINIFKCTSTTNHALHVSYIPSTEPGVFRMLNGSEKYTYLGITWGSRERDPIPGSESSLWAQVTAVSRPRHGKTITASSETGATGTEIWTLGPDNTIQATWMNGCKLDVITVHDRLYAAGDQTAYREKYGLRCTTRWVFEDI